MKTKHFSMKSVISMLLAVIICCRHTSRVGLCGTEKRL